MQYQGGTLSKEENKKNLQILNTAKFYEEFYLAKTKAIYDICKNNNVDVSNYIEHYKNIESKTLARATNILTSKNYTFGDIYNIDEGLYIIELKKQFDKIVELISKQTDNKNTTYKDVCLIFKNADKNTINNFRFEVEQPEKYNILMGGH